MEVPRVLLINAIHTDASFLYIIPVFLIFFLIYAADVGITLRTFSSVAPVIANVPSTQKAGVSLHFASLFHALLFLSTAVLLRHAFIF
jgi:hypothetical protein